MKTLGDMIERNAVNHANAEALVYGILQLQKKIRRTGTIER